MNQKLIHCVAYLCFLMVCVVVMTELFIRNIYLVRDVYPFEINTNHFPYFRLQDQAEISYLHIRDHRREKAVRGKRNKSIVFIGDSITFGPGIPDDQTFVERVHTQQSQYDAYNLGVPGYGLPEILSVVKGELPIPQPNIIFYTVNYNDFFDAMPILLSLLRTPKDRLASWEDYEPGMKPKIKNWVKDHFKTPFVLNYHLGQTAFFSSATKPASPPLDPVVNPVVIQNPTDCSQQLEKDANASYYYKKAVPFWKALANDQNKSKLISNYFLEMKNEALKRQSHFIVAINHEYPFLKSNDQTIDSALKKIFTENKISYLDTWPLYKTNFERCHFFLENDTHLDSLGNQIYAELVMNTLKANQSAPPNTPDVNFSDRVSRRKLELRPLLSQY